MSASFLEVVAWIEIFFPNFSLYFFAILYVLSNAFGFISWSTIVDPSNDLDLKISPTTYIKPIKTSSIRSRRHAKLKAKKNKSISIPVYVLNFNGDIEASSVENLKEEITAILKSETKCQELVLRLESPGGTVWLLYTSDAADER